MMVCALVCFYSAAVSTVVARRTMSLQHLPTLVVTLFLGKYRCGNCRLQFASKRWALRLHSTFHYVLYTSTLLFFLMSADCGVSGYAVAHALAGIIHGVNSYDVISWPVHWFDLLHFSVRVLHSILTTLCVICTTCYLLTIFALNLRW